MPDLKSLIRSVPDYPQPGILFRDISPLLRSHFPETIAALDGLFTEQEWQSVQAVAGIESRGFILAAAMAARRGKGFVLVRKQGKLPPPVVDVPYALEYGTGVLEMQRGEGSLRVSLEDGAPFGRHAARRLEVGLEQLGDVPRVEAAEIG